MNNSHNLKFRVYKELYQVGNTDWLTVCKAKLHPVNSSCLRRTLQTSTHISLKQAKNGAESTDSNYRKRRQKLNARFQAKITISFIIWIKLFDEAQDRYQVDNFDS